MPLAMTDVIFGGVGMIKRLRGRLAESGGFTLSEMVVVLAILGIVLAALVQLFVSASNAQVDMSKRVDAQQNARVALDKLRREIHCARTVSGTVPGNSITITLGSYCPTNTSGADQTVTWCATGSSAPFALRRSTATCDATSRKWADYLTTAQVFAAYSPSKVSTAWSAGTPYVVGQYVRPTNPVTTPYLKYALTFAVLLAAGAGVGMVLPRILEKRSTTPTPGSTQASANSGSNQANARR